MNIKKIVATTLLLVAAGTAFADVTTAPSSKTRAQVVAELKQAYDQGTLPQNDADFSGDHRFSMHKMVARTQAYKAETN
jgi:hypothetical protein